MIYILLFIACFVFVLLENTSNTESLIRIGQKFFVLVLILFIGFRLVGADYPNYEDMYYNTSDAFNDVINILEPFFYYSMKLFRSQHLSFPIYTCMIAALSVLMKAYALNKYSPYFFMSVVIGLPVVFIGDMGQMRSSLAMATLMLSIPYCINKKPIWFGLLVLAAINMHISAAIFIVVYFLSPLKMNLPYMLLIWLACFLGSYILDNTFIGDLIDTFARDSMIDTKVSNYLNEGSDIYTGRIVFTVQGIFFRILTLGLIYYVPTDQDRLKSFFVNTYFIGNCLFFLFSFNEIMSLRTSLYYTCFEIIAIPFVLYTIKNRFTYWLLLGLFIVRSFYQFYTLIYVQFPDMYLPYRNALMNLW